jgi:hypothetical protein
MMSLVDDLNNLHMKLRNLCHFVWRLGELYEASSGKLTFVIVSEAYPRWHVNISEQARP